MSVRKLLTSLMFLAVATGCGNQGSSQGKAASPGAPGGGSTWQKYEDPLEQAFTLEVPRGWTVKGGMFRLGYSDHRMMIDMTSPDGKVNVRLGDVAIPTYFLPNQFHREGEIYDLGEQAQGRVERYRKGDEFARSYGKVRFAHTCASLTPQSTTLPPIVKVDPPKEARQSSEGETTYGCGGRTAYIYAQTALMEGLWQVSSLASYVTPPALVPQTRDIILHASKSLQLSPGWIQKQARMDAEGLAYQRRRQQKRREAISAQVAQFEAGMQAMRSQVSAFERGQAQRQRQFDAVDNIISGITPTTDPYGNTVSVINGPKSHDWINPATGETRNSDLRPGPGWELLTPKQ